MELPFDRWLQAILLVANDSDAHGVSARRLRSRLDQLIDDALPLRGKLKRELPPLFVAIHGRRLQITSDVGPTSGHEVDEIEREGYIGWLTKQRAAQLEAAIYALSTSGVGARVRRCGYEPCGRFFVARRNHRRKHHFCCPEHRHAFGREHRDKKKWAQYMRGYRKHPRRRIRR